MIEDRIPTDRNYLEWCVTMSQAPNLRDEIIFRAGVFAALEEAEEIAALRAAIVEAAHE